MKIKMSEGVKSTHITRNVLLFTGLALAITWLVMSVAPARANGVPVKIFLNYLPEFSTYGPIDAVGTVEVSIGEAWIDLRVQGLPRLEDAMYEGWLQEVGTQQVVSVGKFNATEQNIIEYYIELGSLPVTEYRYFFITQEADPDTSPFPDERRLIAGVFPDPQLEIIIETPTPTPASNQTDTLSATPGAADNPAGSAESEAAAPPTLPVTGLDVSFEWGISVVLGLGLTALGILYLKGHLKL